MKNNVILIDENDNIIGYEEKLIAHKKALLHRAFSILIFNDKNELLIHQRAMDKYHCPGIWTNTCCSHPKKGETYLEAANRRLLEECGFQANLKYIGKFIYKAKFDNGLTEHELDNVFIGKYNGNIDSFNKEEIHQMKNISLFDLKEDIKQNPKEFSPWFKIIIERFEDKFF
jgi:isopentenyl-diphosphate delta-isomerase